MLLVVVATVTASQHCADYRLTKRHANFQAMLAMFLQCLHCMFWCVGLSRLASAEECGELIQLAQVLNQPKPKEDLTLYGKGMRGLRLTPEPDLPAIAAAAAAAAAGKAPAATLAKSLPPPPRPPSIDVGRGPGRSASRAVQAAGAAKPAAAVSTKASAAATSKAGASRSAQKPVTGAGAATTIAEGSAESKAAATTSAAEAARMTGQLPVAGTAAAAPTDVLTGPGNTCLHQRDTVEDCMVVDEPRRKGPQAAKAPAKAPADIGVAKQPELAEGKVGEVTGMEVAGSSRASAEHALEAAGDMGAGVSKLGGPGEGGDVHATGDTSGGMGEGPAGAKQAQHQQQSEQGPGSKQQRHDSGIPAANHTDDKQQWEQEQQEEVPGGGGSGPGDNSLRAGWSVEYLRRSCGTKQGARDVRITSPEGEVFKSFRKAWEHLGIPQQQLPVQPAAGAAKSAAGDTSTAAAAAVGSARRSLGLTATAATGARGEGGSASAGGSSGSLCPDTAAAAAAGDGVKADGSEGVVDMGCRQAAAVATARIAASAAAAAAAGGSGVGGGGNQLPDDWDVDYNRRPNGGRDVKITSPEGEVFKSFKKAWEHLGILQQQQQLAVQAAAGAAKSKSAAGATGAAAAAVGMARRSTGSSAPTTADQASSHGQKQSCLQQSPLERDSEPFDSKADRAGSDAAGGVEVGSTAPTAAPPEPPTGVSASCPMATAPDQSRIEIPHAHASAAPPAAAAAMPARASSPKAVPASDTPNTLLSEAAANPLLASQRQLAAAGTDTAGLSKCPESAKAAPPRAASAKGGTMKAAACAALNLAFGSAAAAAADGYAALVSLHAPPSALPASQAPPHPPPPPSSADASGVETARAAAHSDCSAGSSGGMREQATAAVATAAGAATQRRRGLGPHPATIPWYERVYEHVGLKQRLREKAVGAWWRDCQLGEQPYTQRR